LGDWRDWQRVALPFVTGNCVLEVGHGPGHMLVALRSLGFDVVGLDLSGHMVRMAHRRLARAGLDVPCVRGRVQALPFAPALYDTVLATFPTLYVVDPASLAAVYRVLKPNGRFVIVPEGHLTGSGPVPRFVEWLYTITGQRQDTFAVGEERGWPNEDSWRPFQQRFVDVGFEVDVHPVRLRRSAATVVVAHKA
jgi:ubiquinone/menaquinone biosynthesis C-methylase UbiE